MTKNMSGHGSRVWQPLNIANREIRVLNLASNPDFGAPLSGRLRTVSLDDLPEYDAISHAWGRAGHVQTLHLDGRSVIITGEINACLRHLRYEAAVRALWIDAVCIDQQNPTERGNQVTLMRHIFGQAAVVQVWLGYALGQIEELVGDIAKASRSQDGGMPRWDADAKHEHRFLDLQVSLLLSQDWWLRLWIRQEVALAKTVRLHYGNCSVELQQLHEWAQALDLLSGGGYAYVACVRQVTNLTNLRAVVSNRDRDALAFVLADSRASSVADARDRVYGQLGIVSAVLQQDIMRTDYALCTEAVFVNFAFRLIRSCSSLSLLNQASSQYNSIQGLPTWVPDWTSRYSFALEQTRSLDNTHFHATAGRPMPKPRLVRSIKAPVDLLGVRGHAFAVCKQVGPVCERISSAETGGALSRLILSKWWPLFREGHEDDNGTRGSDFRTSPTVAANIGAQFAATMLRGVHWNQDGEHSERFLDDFEAVPWFDAIMETCAAHGPMPELDTRMELFIGGIERTRFFVDSHGRPGLGPTDLEPDDVLALLLGGDMPYALRRTNSDRESNVYTFIGECYVHGAMDGELFDEDLVQDIQLA